MFFSPESLMGLEISLTVESTESQLEAPQGFPLAAREWRTGDEKSLAGRLRGPPRAARRMES